MTGYTYLSRTQQWSAALCVAIATLSGTAPSIAGTVEDAFIQATVTMQVQEGRLNACGYRFNSVSASAGPGQVTMIDSSVSLYAKGIVLLKAGALQSTISADGKASKPVVRPIQSFWLKARGDNPTKPEAGTVMPSDSPKGYLLYAIGLDSFGPLVRAVTQGEQLLIAARLAGSGIDTIHSGTVQVSESDAEKVAACMKELLERMRDDLESESVRGKGR